MITPAAMTALARLPAGDLAAVAPALLPPVRNRLRNRAVLMTIARFYGGMSRTGAAQALAAHLTAPPAPGTLLSDALAAVRALNGGRPMCWRTILDILNTPER